MRRRAFVPGDQIRFTGKFLRDTGMLTGASGTSRWRVQAVRSNGWLVTDERHSSDYATGLWTDAELAADPLLWFRTVNPSNVEIVR